MFNNWKDTILEDVCISIYSGGTPSRREPKYWNGEINWLSSGETGQRYINKTKETITTEGVEKSSTRLANAQSTVIATAGQGFTRGQTSYLLIDTYINQSVICLKADETKIDSKFLFFNLSNRYDELRKISDGNSIRGSITTQMLKSLNIKLPSVAEQKSIANILSSLDDKIENNNAIIANLEEQAQTIFKSWFIDFKPFQDEEFIDSELGKIPAGWDITALDEIANYQNGLAMQKYRPIDDEESLPVLKIKELRANQIDSNSERCTTSIPNNVRISDGDVIFSWSGSLLVEIWTGGEAGLNQHLFKVTSDIYNKWFYYYWTKYFLEHFVAIARDRATTMGHIKRSHLKEAKVLIPDKDTFNHMDLVMNPIVLEIINLGKQNKKLEELRDTLLPKLMWGEIRVGDVVIEE